MPAVSLITPRRGAAIAALCGAVFLAACGSSSSSSSSQATGALASANTTCQGVKTGGNLVWATNAAVINMDPANTQDPMSIQAELAGFDTLVHLNPQGTAEEPDLAQSWTVSPNGKVWTFHLRPGIKFSNGQPITAADVVWSYNRLRAPSSVVDWTLASVASDEAVNPTTVKVTLKKPWAPFLSDTQLWGAAILDPAAVPKMGKNFANVANFVGSGPFIVSSWSQGNAITFKRNPYYWQKDACGQRLPYLSGLTIKYVPDDNTRVTSIEGGSVDAINAVPYNEVATLSAQSGIHAPAAPAAAVVSVPINESTVPAVKNEQVVQALNYALDRAAIVKVAFSGHALASGSPIDYGVKYYTPQYGYPYNLAKAKALIAQTPYAHGFSMTLIIPSGDAAASAVAQIMQTDLAQINVHVAIQQLDSTTVFAQESAGKFQAGYLSGTAQNLDPDSNALYTSVTNGGADSAHTGWDNPAANNIFYQTETALNSSVRGSLYNRWQKIVMEDEPILWIAYPQNTYAYRTDVHNFLPQITLNFDLADVWKG
jgi:peptide/nickel transport system substrate-binding protein